MFEQAIENGIEMYRFIQNDTYLTQPWVFKRGYVTREPYRKTADVKIDRTNLAQKLQDVYMLYFKSPWEKWTVLRQEEHIQLKAKWSTSTSIS